MKATQLIAALILVTAGGSAFAGEVCSEMEKVNGVLTSVPIPCSKLNSPAHQAEREEKEAQKRKCGKDFQALRIGMTIERYEECTEALSFVTDTVSKGATVETYRSTFYFINARNGRIVSYTRRTH